MTDDLLNKAASPGHNEAPDYAQQVTDRMASEYAEVMKTLDSLLDDARQQPVTIASDQEALNCGAVIKRFKDLDNRLENVRVVEGEPYLRSKNAIDAFFFGLRDKIGRRNKNDRKAKAGATDILQARIDDHQERKLAEARRVLAEQEAERVRLARIATAEAAETARVAEVARQAAERARKVETAAVKHSIADVREGAAAQARVQAENAERLAEDARLASLAKSADLVRTRGNDESGAGVTLTMAQEPYCLVVDRSKLDAKVLLPFFTDSEIDKAARQWAKTTGHRVQMDGVEVGFRNKGVTR